ncbi:MAG: Ig-like domain-containing protein [Bacteroidota bacterium]|nr:Ig-like domain-containing protein [Bacteroidota bacterium]
MSYEWITPKTDWVKTDQFTYQDYNRIRNNLLFLNDRFNNDNPEKAVEINLGLPKTSYDNDYFPSEFEAFEKALDSFKRMDGNVNVGERGYYKGNNNFVNADGLNHLEKSCLNWFNFNVAITSATLTPTPFEVGIGDTIQLTLSVLPLNAKYTVEYSSTDTSVATVSSTGLVTGISNGTFNVKALIKQKNRPDIILWANGESAIPIEDIIIPSKIRLTYQDSKKIPIQIVPANADINRIKYSVDDDYIHTDGISNDGLTVSTHSASIMGSTYLTIRAGSIEKRCKIVTRWTPNNGQGDSYGVRQAMVFDDSLFVVARKSSNVYKLSKRDAEGKVMEWTSYGSPSSINDSSFAPYYVFKYTTDYAQTWKLYAFGSSNENSSTSVLCVLENGVWRTIRTYSFNAYQCGVYIDWTNNPSYYHKIHICTSNNGEYIIRGDNWQIDEHVEYRDNFYNSYNSYYASAYGYNAECFTPNGRHFVAGNSTMQYYDDMPSVRQGAYFHSSNNTRLMGGEIVDNKGLSNYIYRGYGRGYERQSDLKIDWEVESPRIVVYQDCDDDDLYYYILSPLSGRKNGSYSNHAPLYFICTDIKVR